ncbi:hypothetical protein [Sphingomonas sanguinis]|uniref:hypothetical protein n=1 Tax=Sphingomonas sanguinis TaxID=33051 RepID=UPI000AC332B9|nr:hypothetical protein [Sphingomonas sanguinis]
MNREDRIAAVAAMRDLEASPMPRETGQILVGQYVFATKADAIKKTKEIIASVSADGMTDEAQAFFQALADNHPSINEKTEARPYVVEPTGYRYANRLTIKTVSLRIQFTDRPDWKTDNDAYHRHRAQFPHNSIPLGVDACLRIVPHHQRVKAAARMIAGKPSLHNTARRYMQSNAVRKSHLTCSICKTWIESDDLHWDHHPHGFSDIFREWRIQMLLTWQGIRLDHANQHRFTDPNLASSWYRFHEYFANFRPTCSECNIADKDRLPLILTEEEWQDWCRSNSDTL